MAIQLTWLFLEVTVILANANQIPVITVHDTENPFEPEQTPSSLYNRNCNQKLGMESGDISDDHLFVSSSVGYGYGKEDARLNGDSAWVTYAVSEQYIQIDLENQMYISGVQTQSKLIPNIGSKPWVTSYKVMYKANRIQPEWQEVSEGVGRPTIFNGNTDAVRVVTNMFPRRIQAQFIRIVPTAWVHGQRKIALRLELLGCNINAKSGCGTPRVLTNPTGIIASMNYPHNYDNNANCRWDITAPTGKVITLQFEDGFHLEASPNNCRLEYVEVVDVIGNTDQSMGKFCGRVQPGKFTSTYSQLKVRFMTDHYEGYRGFQARYTFVNGSGCGGPQVLQDATGSFHSMNFPQNYDNNAYCVWDISTDLNKLIEINFTNFRVKRGLHNTCTEDNLQILNIGNGNSSRYCGTTTPNDFISSSNHLRVIFQTNGIFTDQGFEASYKTVAASGCGGKRDRKEPTGMIHSLNYPKPYTHSLRCQWNIIAQPNEDIRITFLNFDLEEHNNCDYDYVSIYDGSQRHLLGRYCNRLNIEPLVAHSGIMKVIFVSDKYNEESGFEASYNIVVRTRPMVITTTTTENITSALTTKLGTTPQQSIDRLQTYAAKMNTKRVLVHNTTKQIMYQDTTTARDLKTKQQKSEYQTQGTIKHTKKNQVDEKNPPNQLISEEMTKWIIIGLVVLLSIFMGLVLFGLILCYRQQTSNRSITLQNSFSQGKSGVMQNHAYDCSIASTNHSIRSRRAEAPETSQVSDNFSHQGTLRRAPSKESHIYFSIDEYSINPKSNTTTAHTKNNSNTNIKAHYKKIQKGSRHGNTLSDESPATTLQSEEEEFYEDDDESNTFNEDSELEGSDVFTQTGRTSRCNTMEKPLASPTGKTLLNTSAAERPKMMVDNILYESADSIDE